MDDEHNSRLINLTADIVTAHVANQSVAVSDVALVIRTVHATLADLGRMKTPEPATPEPAVPIRSSIKPDYIVCLEDGKKLKTLKRHLMAHFGMTPADYRAKWNLPATYPMVAPSYAEARRMIAKTVGLGRKPRTAKTSTPKVAGRRKVAGKK